MGIAPQDITPPPYTPLSHRRYGCARYAILIQIVFLFTEFAMYFSGRSLIPVRIGGSQAVGHPPVAWRLVRRVGTHLNMVQATVNFLQLSRSQKVRVTVTQWTYQSMRMPVVWGIKTLQYLKGRAHVALRYHLTCRLLTLRLQGGVQTQNQRIVPCVHVKQEHLVIVNMIVSTRYLMALVHK